MLNTRTRHDTTTDNVMHNKAKLLGKISQRVLCNSDANTTDQETTTNVRRNNYASTTQKEQSDDDEDNNDEDNDDGEDDKHVPNGDDLSNSRFLNGSYNEQHIHMDHNKEKGNQETNQQTTTSKPLYDDELEKYGRSDAVAVHKRCSTRFICRTQVS